jgi:hypothetical protein
MTDTAMPIIPTPMFTASIKSRFWVKRRGKDRMRQAIDLRNQGLTYQAIADKLGYASRMSAYSAVNDSVVSRQMARKGIPDRRSAMFSPKTTQDTAPHDASARTGDPVNAERRAA